MQLSFYAKSTGAKMKETSCWQCEASLEQKQTEEKKA